MDSVRIVQSSVHSSTVQVYNAQVLIKHMHCTYYQAECNISTAIGLVPCTIGKEHLCWHIKRAVAYCIRGNDQYPSEDIEWFTSRGAAFWMWAGNSMPMSLVHVESKGKAHGWAVVRGMLSGMELAALECKGA